ncbi:hypothetical protein HK100_003765 [Physocladia obscura]|uniref:CID domain-containing protein n=1 Tax=Physocladia obscura TaxID=109957 RepID=A0AAD5SVT7_9FUNG|nr:hypothetical protein HK100_003765 [Physocladia obscura]
MSDFDEGNEDSEDEILDGFECRAQFKALLNTLSSSQQVVTRVSQFASKSSNRPHAAIMYGCIRERLDATPTINRLHLLYVLDAICRTTAIRPTNNNSSTNRRPSGGWLDLVSRDLPAIISALVPATEPVNVKQVSKFVKSWRDKHLFTSDELDAVEAQIARVTAEMKKNQHLHVAAVALANGGGGGGGGSSAGGVGEKVFTYSRAEIMKRIEEDRDRHKKAREEGWFVHPDLGASASVSDVSVDFDSSRVLARDEFSEVREKIPGLTMEQCREWDLINEDFQRYDAEHTGFV